MSVFRRAVEIVRNGHLGRIERIEVGLPDGYDKPMGDATVTAPPENLNYELWTGPGAAVALYACPAPSLVARASGLWRRHADGLDWPP